MTRLSDAQFIIDQLQRCRTPKGMEALLFDAAREMGFDNVTMYHHVDLSSISPTYIHMSRGDLIGLTTCSTVWSEHYRDHNLVSVDPRVLASRCTTAPFQTGEVGRFIKIAAAQRAVVERQKRADIGEGFTIPAHFPAEPTGSCTFSMFAGRTLPTNNFAMASWIGMSAFQAARAMLVKARNKHISHGVPRLTGRQLQCALLVGGGLCESEIAHRLGISSETVKRHLKDARSAYGVTKSIQIVVRALNYGQFTLRDILSATGAKIS